MRDILVDNETRASFDRYDISSTIFTSSTVGSTSYGANTSHILSDRSRSSRQATSLGKDKEERKSRQRFANSVALKGGLSLAARLRYKTIYVS